MSVTQWFQTQAANFYDTWIQKLVPLYEKVSIPKVRIVKNSSTLAVSAAIKLSFKLGFVFVNGFRETCFVDALRT